MKLVDGEDSDGGRVVVPLLNLLLEGFLSHADY